MVGLRATTEAAAAGFHHSFQHMGHYAHLSAGEGRGINQQQDVSGMYVTCNGRENAITPIRKLISLPTEPTLISR